MPLSYGVRLFACGLLLSSLSLAAGGVDAAPPPGETRLLRDPALAPGRILFSYGGDLWSVDRSGGNPLRLTSDPADERDLHVSPDGRYVAFSRQQARGYDVYVMPVTGGIAHRLTWHPATARVTGWSRDGEHVVFASSRAVNRRRGQQAWEVPAAGGAPRRIMRAPFADGDFAGPRLAYIAFPTGYDGLYGAKVGWKGYRGGRTPAIRLLDLEAGTLRELPGGGANNIKPRWDGDALYFLSDRELGAFNVYRSDAAGAAPLRLSAQELWDARAMDVRDGALVYEAAGRLWYSERAGEPGSARPLSISLPADRPLAQPHWKSVAGQAEGLALSPTGRRVLMSARGEVFTVPVEHGSTRNLTRSDGVREYPALWSPRGDRLAWVRQEPAEQVLVIADQDGERIGEPIVLGEGFHELLAFSPDGHHVAYADEALRLWLLNVETGARREVSRHLRREQFVAGFSTDGQWLAFTREARNALSDLRLVPVAGGDAVTVTDGSVDVTDLAFSPDGKYLYFSASTNAGPVQTGLDLSAYDRPVRKGLYAVVLAADSPSPLAPRRGDEEGSEEEGDEEGSEEQGDTEGEQEGEEGEASAALPESRIDAEGLDTRIVPLPIDERRYRGLAVARDGDLLFLDVLQPGAMASDSSEAYAAGNRLLRFDQEKRETSTLVEGVRSFALSAGGEHIVLRRASGAIQTAKLGDKVEPEALDTSGVRLRIDPPAEWRQIFEDAVRMEAAYFYAGNMHGLDWEAVAERYRAMLPHVARREDLGELIVEMIAELRVGHNYVIGGDEYEPSDEAPAGLLGADLAVERGAWRIERIYRSSRWNPFVEAPLGAPGLDVRAGDAIVAVDGQPLAATDNPFRLLEGTAGKQTRLTLRRREGGKGKATTREAVVVPTKRESELRLWHWIGEAQARVDEATGGRVGYVYLPDTGRDGFDHFNRLFYAQVDREALIIDGRMNGGGKSADYVLERLSRPYLASWAERHAMPFDTPGGLMDGPLVMLIDQYAGSGGDFLPWGFRRLGLGPLIGKRTWGGLIGISANPAFVDGGQLTVPYFRFFTPEGEWRIENEGVAPDIEVLLDPVAFNRGVDSQLERAIEEILARLEGYEPRRHRPVPTLPAPLAGD